jgi:hypothetical protein
MVINYRIVLFEPEQILGHVFYDSKTGNVEPTLLYHVEDWFEAHNISFYRIILYNSDFVLCFEKEEDAILFKLTWL